MIKPIISEKSFRLAKENNVYMFKTNGKMNKKDMKKYIEELFDVKVVDVKSNKRHSDIKRNYKYRTFVTADKIKKFYVKLKDGDKIDIYKKE